MSDGTLVDTNVLLDLVTDDPVWAGWSVLQMDAASLRGPLLISDIIYAELSVRFGRIEEIERLLVEAGLVMAPVPWPALFLAGKVFRRYRSAGGTRTGVLPDLFIGAHAAVAGLKLLTRDRRRFVTYYPSITLIAPPG